MSRIKKIIVLLFMIMGMLILGTSKVEALPGSGNIVDVDSLKEGQTWHIGYQQYEKFTNLFCAEKGQRQWSAGRDYKLIAHIRINNSESWRIDKDGEKKNHQTTENSKLNKDYNRKLATAITTLKGNDLKYFIWGYMKTWVQWASSKYSVIPPNFATQWSSGDYSDITDEVNEAMKDVEDSLEDFDMKYKEKDINFSTLDIDGKKYTRVGPFQMVGIPSEGLRAFKVYDQDAKQIKGAKIIKYVGGEIEEIDVTQKGSLKNNKNFYICIPKNSEATEITARVTLREIKSTDVKADIFLLKCSDVSWQNLVVVDGKKTSGDGSIYELTVPLVTMPGNLTIIKQNEDGTENLSGAKFVIYKYVTDENGTWYKKGDGYTQDKNEADDQNITYARQYVCKENKNYYTYVKTTYNNIKDDSNYIFKTGKDGKIELENLKKGTYFATEVEAPAGYKKIDGPIRLGAVKAQEPREEKVHNSPDTSDNGDLTIIKLNGDGTETLAGAKFLIYIKSDDRYSSEFLGKDNTYKKDVWFNIQNNDNYVFTTGDDGRIVLDDLKVGVTYYAMEIEAPKGYKKIDGTITLGEVKEQEPIFKRINNEPDTPPPPVIPDDPEAPISVTIHKVDQDDNTLPMPGVRFKFYSHKLGGWLTGSYGLVSNESDATWFTTDASGNIYLPNLPIEGTWSYKEDLTSLPYGYNVTENENGSFTLVREYEWVSNWVVIGGVPIDLGKNEPQPIVETITVTNKQKYVKLSGFVWVDKVDAKSGDAKDSNNLFKTPDSHGPDENDLLFDEITVKLMDRTTGQVVMTTKTGNLGLYTEDSGHNGHGEYQFVDVLKDKLQDYYVAFEYDGINYTNVQPNINNEKNGSKAMETEKARSDLNNKFGSVEKDVAIGTGTQAGVRSPLMYDVNPGQGEEKQTSTYSGYRDSNYEIGPDNSYIKQNVIGDFPIIAETDATGYKIIDHFKAGQTEIKYINLGLKDRDRPDFSLGKDLQNVKVAINGYEHTYNYDQRYDINSLQYDGEGFNVGVKFASQYKKGSYSRAIYKSDMEYKPKDATNELTVYVTYKIKLIQANINLKTRINSIVDYYDEEYTVECAGHNIDGKGNVIDKISDDKVRVDPAYASNGYHKVLIECNKELTAQQPTDIYVRFKLSRSQVLGILGDKGVGERADKLLDNVAEINSYTVFDDYGKLYAGIDKDSNPGNFEPGTSARQEDDTDSSPALQLEVADAREITGKVFEDNVVPEAGQDPSGVMTGKVRQGSGAYEDGEKGIGEVDINFKDKKSGITYKTKTVANPGYYRVERDDTKTITDSNGYVIEYTYNITPTTNDGNINTYQLGAGDFYITNYIPGDYTLTYIWGDEEYPVQEYKGTVYDKNRYSNIMNDSAKRWWDIWNIDKKDGNETKSRADDSIRRTDAIDNYKTRQQIDEYMKVNNKDTNDNITKGYQQDVNGVITKMDSSTPEMKIAVEYETIYSASGGDRYTYCIDEVDFGIVERAKQRLDLAKRIKSMKVTLANGQVIVDLIINEDGTISGERNSITYMKPDPNIEPRNGFIRLELDNELIQGTTLEVVYELKATNNSELDYIPKVYDLEDTRDTVNTYDSAHSKDATFYKFGTLDDNQELVTIEPSGLIDYLDNGWSFDSVKYDSIWKVRTANGTAGDIRELVKDEVIDNEDSTIAKKMILYTETLKGKNLKPIKDAPKGESATVDLNVSKKLTTTDEISLDNETEEVIVSKTGGSILQTTPGNYIPGKGATEVDDSMAETSIVTPATGANLNYIIPIVVGTTALIILGAGVIIIKKKVLSNK